MHLIDKIPQHLPTSLVPPPPPAPLSLRLSVVTRMSRSGHIISSPLSTVTIVTPHHHRDGPGPRRVVTSRSLRLVIGHRRREVLVRRVVSARPFLSGELSGDRAGTGVGRLAVLSDQRAHRMSWMAVAGILMEGMEW